MRLVVLVSLLTFVAAPVFAQHAFTPDEIAEGARLFQTNCTGCHGSSGDLVQGVALMSGKFRRASSDDEVATIIRKGVPGTAMQGFSFTEQQAGMIVAYFRSFTAAPAATPADMPALGDPARGKAILEGKGNCLSCHRVGENGSRVGPDLTGGTRTSSAPNSSRDCSAVATVPRRPGCGYLAGQSNL
jgi:mono/diheme cytochrome c family protein